MEYECRFQIYLIIVAVVLLILALFNFFGDTASKVAAGFKLLLAIAFLVAIIWAIFKKDAQIMAGVMIAALIFIILDIIGILISFFGEAFVSILFAIIRIVFLVHLFFVANKVRRAYKAMSESK
nr:unnamed protein product [Haemonchus contortus]